MIIGFICLSLLCLIGWFIAFICIISCYKSGKEKELLKERLKEYEDLLHLDSCIDSFMDIFQKGER